MVCYRKVYVHNVKDSIEVKLLEKYNMEVYQQLSASGPLEWSSPFHRLLLFGFPPALCC